MTSNFSMSSERTYIIAEIGSNFETLPQALESIAIAKACGADAAKFQLHSPSALYGFCGGTDAYSLPLDWLPKLKEKADAWGIDLGITAFSPELVAVVDPFVPWHKVASSDCTWPQLLEAVAKTGKPVLLSTGASSFGDVISAFTVLRNAVPGGAQVVLLYCVAAYPARSADLRVMRVLEDAFGLPVGFSDHTLDVINAPVDARSRGAVVIEKHFTAFPDLDTPDRPHSLTPDEFKRMVDAVRGVTQPVIAPSYEERDMLLRHKRRLIATRDIAIGDRLDYGVNFGAYRSLTDDAHGLNPMAWGAVNGKPAKVALRRGASIGPGDF